MKIGKQITEQDINRAFLATADAIKWMQWHLSLGNIEMPGRNNKKCKLNNMLAERFIITKHENKWILAAYNLNTLNWFPLMPWVQAIVYQKGHACYFTLVCDKITPPPFKGDIVEDELEDIEDFSIDFPFHPDILKTISEDNNYKLQTANYEFKNDQVYLGNFGKAIPIKKVKKD